jgi:predicted DNA-binding WGR domain protein
MARFYALDLEPTLFGPVALIRRWGRIGADGQHREEWFASWEAARAALADWAAVKQRRGYEAAC